MEKITFLALHLGYGGIEKCISDVANMLVNDYEIEILSTYKVYDDPIFKLNKNIKITYLTNLKPNRKEFKNYVKHFRFISAFKEGIKSLKILYLKKKKMKEAILNLESDYIISTRDYLNDLLGKYGNGKKIAWEHNHHNNNKKYVKKIMNSCKNIDKLVLVSKELQEYYDKLFKNNNIECECVYIPNFISKIPKDRTKLNNNNMVAVGRFEREKAFLDLINVFKLIEIENGDCHLDIVGDGQEFNKIRKKIITLNLTRKIKLHGFKNQEYINKLYKDSSIYLMTSRTESFGLVLIEAMSHGVVPIVFDSAKGAKEIIQNNYNGYFIKNRNEHEMASKVLELLNDKKKLKEISNNAIDTSKKFTSDHIRKYWLELLRGDAS